MKKGCSIILILVMLISLTVACKKGMLEETRQPEGGVIPVVPVGFVQRDDGEILLEKIVAPSHMTVDLNGFIYIGDVNAVYVIKEDNVPVVIIEDLLRCVGLTVYK